ncbi:phage/plasmid primase, P4 family [Clostridium sp. C2-6-12]|uniref:DNA primase family protein n=1 Tax=Clostridium sp. C2-6-12 TaxID=2698832 RepID=UPI00136F74AB|nr:phage/plasmid primase, P4 family [Clostridium sp. C2-6-12]
MNNFDEKQNNFAVQLKRGDEVVFNSNLKQQEKEDIGSITQGKVCSELTDYYLNLGIFKVINDSLYMYNHSLGYLIKLKEGREAVKLINLIKDKRRKNRIASKTIEEVIKRLKNIEEINLEYEEVNANPQYINCKNGVVDILSGELMTHDIKHKFTYCINAEYISSKEIRWNETEKFFNTSLEANQTKVQLLMEVIGYLISDYNNAKKAFIFLGKPHSGKSLLTKIISKLVGCENISNIPFHKLGDRFSNAELSINKLNINAELDSTPIRKISNFKAIVGNDYLSAEFKGKPLFSFKSKTKLLFCGNYMPEIKDIESTEAFLDRLVFLMFNRSTPKEEMDYCLEEKLMKEIDLIFTVAIWRLKTLVLNNFQFTMPKDSKEFLNEYSNRQNHIQEFISEACILESNAKIHTKDLYNIYLKFCNENCISPYNLIKFNEYIATIDGVDRSRFRINGKNLRGFMGVSIKNFMVDGTEQ